MLFTPVIKACLAWYLTVGCLPSGLVVVGGLQASLSAQEPSPTDRSLANDVRKFPGKSIRDAMEKAAQQYQQAVEQAPQHAPSHVGVAEWYTALWCFGFVSREDSLPIAKKAAMKAVELDGELAAAHTALGVIRLSDWDWAEAERELQCAIELDPKRANSRHWYALYLSAMGRHDEAISQSEEAVKLDPSPGNRTGLGAILYFARDFDRMQIKMQATLTQHPDFAIGYDWLGMAQVQLAQFDDAIVTYQKAVELSDGIAEVKAGLGHAYGVAGKQAEARGILRELNELSQQWHIPPVQVAFVHVSLGEKDDAFRWLERAFEQKSWELAFLQVEPWLDDLRSDPRFSRMVQRMNFPSRSD